MDHARKCPNERSQAIFSSKWSQTKDPKQKIPIIFLTIALRSPWYNLFHDSCFQFRFVLMLLTFVDRMYIRYVEHIIVRPRLVCVLNLFSWCHPSCKDSPRRVCFRGRVGCKWGVIHIRVWEIDMKPAWAPSLPQTFHPNVSWLQRNQGSSS